MITFNAQSMLKDLSVDMNTYLATNLLEFQKLNSLPVNVNLDKLDEGSGIAETLQSHAAMYHKSYYLKYTSNKVRRLQKRILVTSNDESSSKKTRSQLNVSICQQVQSIPKCFFVMNQVGNYTKPAPQTFDYDSDAMVLAKVAKLIRRQSFGYQSNFNGSFNSECQRTAVPDVLMTLIRMILGGTNIVDQPNSRSGRSNVACVISQLIAFNSVKFSSGSSNIVRHSEDRETPLHVAHAAKHGHQKVSIWTVDTDVVVLAVAQIQHLQISELWIEFGIGKH